LFSIPLGKPHHFDGENYSWWSCKMRSHLFSLHPCIWDIIENGFNIPDVHDEDCNEVEVEKQIHRNAQAIVVLLDSLCREEYNKVNGLEKQRKYGTLHTSHTKGT
jgi:hypothetical protein